MAELKPHLQQKVQPTVQRWEAFVAKVNQRVSDVMEEAQTGLDQLIASHATDAGPMGTALTAVQSRFRGIDDKVDTAWEQVEELLEEPLEEILDDDDLAQEDFDAVYGLQEQLRLGYDGLREHIETQYAWLEMRNQAAWARKLYEIVHEEAGRGLNCSQCGGAIENATFWQASNVTCPHCQSVNSVQPGMAAGLFYQGIGMHALSHEQAWNEWLAEQAAKKYYDDRRNQTAGDHARWLDAARAYWTRYYETTRSMNPGFTQEVAEAVQNRIAQYTSFEPPLSGIQREFFENVCVTAAKRDAAALEALLGDMPSGVDLDECATCLVEHGDRDGAVMVLDYRYRAEDEDEPKARWIRDQLKEIADALKG